MSKDGRAASSASVAQFLLANGWQMVAIGSSRARSSSPLSIVCRHRFSRRQLMASILRRDGFWEAQHRGEMGMGVNSHNSAYTYFEKIKITWMVDVIRCHTSKPLV